MDSLLEQVKKLLDETQAVHDKHGDEEKAIKASEGGDFNVFDSIDVVYKENRMSNFVVALMTERKNPQYWKQFTQLFLREVIGDPTIMSEFESGNFAAKREDINEKGRCDIRLEVGSYIVPIEVKINASLRTNQLSDYYECYEKQLTERKVIYYLTKHGEDPSAEGKGGLSPENVKCLSWEKDIQNWIDLCIECLNRNKGNEKILYTLYMFREAIKIFSEDDDMGKQFSDNEIAKVSELIMSGDEVSDSALAVFHAVRKRLLETNNVFARIKRKVESDSSLALTYWDQWRERPGGREGFNQKTYADYILGNSPSNSWVGLPFFYKRLQGNNLFIFIFTPLDKSYGLEKGTLHVSLVTGYRQSPEPPLDNSKLEINSDYKLGNCNYGGYQRFTSSPIFTHDFGIYYEGQNYSTEALDAFAQKAYEYVRALYDFVENYSFSAT